MITTTRQTCYNNILNCYSHNKKAFNVFSKKNFYPRFFSSPVGNISLENLKSRIKVSLTLVTNSKDAKTLGDNYLIVKMFYEGGGRHVQIRFREEEVRDHLELAKLLVQDFSDLIVIINDRPDVAKASGAHGVHLGPTDMPPEDAKKLLGDKSIIGYTVNSLEDVLFANDNDCITYIGVQVFPSKQARVHSPKIWGLDELDQIIAISKKPVITIGGITMRTAPQVLPHLRPWKDGIAIGGEITRAMDVTTVTMELIKLINRE